MSARSDESVDWPGRVYKKLADPGAAASGTELNDAVHQQQPSNFLKHVGALSATKTSDGLVDPKLVLSWLLGALGASPVAIGLLVPIREAGALLPQLALARRVDSAHLKKRFWTRGAFVQAGALAGMAAVAITLSGERAGWMIVALLVLYSLGRAVCSVTYKPLQGATLVKTTRGSASGAGGTVGSIAVFVFGGLLAAGIIPRTPRAISFTLTVAAALWMLAALIVLRLAETPRSAAPDKEPIGALASIGLVRIHAQFRRFVAVRALLTATALAPPFIVLSSSGSLRMKTLGPFVIASALAAATSSFIWGRLSDRSSRTVLIWSGIAGALPLAAVGILGVVQPAALERAWALPLALFCLMIAYQGVRLGRATHVVDMAGPGERARFAAVSNTLIGLVLLAGGLFGWLGHVAGTPTVLMIFAAQCLLASWYARGLDDVQRAESTRP